MWGERVFLVCWSWWVGDRCRTWDLGGVGVLAGYCCFCVVQCFLECCGELEFVVEFIDCDEGSESLACFFGIFGRWVLSFFEVKRLLM